MAHHHGHMKLVLVLYVSWAVSLRHAQPFKAVNLGNWLVTEGWIKPDRFDGIPNKDLLDGTQIQLKSTKLQKYLCAEQGGGNIIVANRSSASGWETFRLWRINETSFNLRVFNKQFVGLSKLNQRTTIIAGTKNPQNTEVLQIIRKIDDPNRIRIRANNGLFLQVISDTKVTADYQGDGWKDSNPSVFIMTILSDQAMHGEYQITNGYGPARAPKVMQDHWNSYITDADFRCISSRGLNAVRIPVGWWIASDPKPPEPFVGGSLKALDNAFTWAQKYRLKVIIDLHAVQGSQNGMEHSASRDGYLEWGDSYIQDTVKVIDFLASRYAKHPSLAAIELMNEPLAPGVNLDSLKNYYKAGYDAVRKYTSSVYVIFSNRLAADSKELLSSAAGLNGVAIDVHYYSLFSDDFKKMNVQQNIDFIYNQRSSDLNAVTSSNGPLIFVGEWTAEFAINGASKEDYQRFARAQLEVYGRASFGWGYWTYKCNVDHWNLRWMLDNGYIKL
ncbi:hypothetical protein FNV43_RR19317 [Rhamnella rubrinervis]|uniref:Mannan endo-1,4-beta-mannosidase n=1 Tax=Rhamnella rubrinervis TaxID=2594499 RepID=A0A8K0E6C6_9ROSA|nr:hypothetical protein FNV43_RR19317 [Rhamnella rubrinervis]